MERFQSVLVAIRSGIDIIYLWYAHMYTLIYILYTCWSTHRPIHCCIQVVQSGVGVPLSISKNKKLHIFVNRMHLLFNCAPIQSIEMSLIETYYNEQEKCWYGPENGLFSDPKISIGEVVYQALKTEPKNIFQVCMRKTK